ncbi:hypothetical protein [Rhodococcus ruber]|uniref:hypothetical protein n=1 Tax=Rhodococcus ruber TaxID=1830 RepID=UPI001F476B13|nr:hypothetical protein [Rhodococcus ruber]MCF8783196.1 hypothetical protein [Rhodococcus ruber]
MATSKSKDIKDALVTLLTGLQLDGEPAFAQVKGHPRGEFNSYPAARVLPDDQSTQKGAQGQNDRTVNLLVRLHVESDKDASEFDKMYILTDLVLDALDSEDYDGNFVDTLQAEELNATRGDWFDTDGPAGPILACDIAVAVSYSRDN